MKITEALDQLLRARTTQESEEKKAAPDGSGTGVPAAASGARVAADASGRPLPEWVRRGQAKPEAPAEPAPAAPATEPVAAAETPTEPATEAVPEPVAVAETATEPATVTASGSEPVAAREAVSEPVAVAETAARPTQAEPAQAEPAAAPEPVAASDAAVSEQEAQAPQPETVAPPVESTLQSTFENGTGAQTPVEPQAEQADGQAAPGAPEPLSASEPEPESATEPEPVVAAPDFTLEPYAAEQSRADVPADGGWPSVESSDVTGEDVKLHAEAPEPRETAPAVTSGFSGEGDLRRLEATAELAETLNLGYHLGAAVERIATAADRGSQGAASLREAAWLIERYVQIMEARPIGADLHASGARLARAGVAIDELKALAAALDDAAE
jgi:hypothetical protein